MAAKHTFPMVLVHDKVKGETTVNSKRALEMMGRRGWKPKPAKKTTRKSTKKPAGTSKSTGASSGPSNSDA